MRSRKLLDLALAAALLALAASAARADYVQQGKLLVFFDAEVAPKALPRSQPAPVKLGFIGSFEQLEGRDVPALQRMTLRLARGGVLNSRGLPRCSRARLVQTTTRAALANCRGALVGGGTVFTAIRFPGAKRSRYRSKLLLFNAGREVLMHIHATEPIEGTFIVALGIRKSPGRFATVLSARFPRLAAGHGHLTGFRMVLGRSYRHRGHKRSYLLASCAAPRGLGRVAFELARVEFRFAGPIAVSNSSLNTCRVRR